MELSGGKKCKRKHELDFKAVKIALARPYLGWLIFSNANI